MYDLLNYPFGYYMMEKRAIFDLQLLVSCSPNRSTYEHLAVNFKLISSLQKEKSSY